MLFPIDKAISVLRYEVRRWRRPVIAHYADTPYTILISCLLSLRTQDKTTDAASGRLFKLANTPRAMRRLSLGTIRKAIYPVGFYKTKAARLGEISDLLIRKHGGRVPDTIEELLELPGVGRKTANLVVTEAYRKPGICVDTHVHRITNRWGYVRTKTPEETEMALRKKLPRRYWRIINELLVTFGQNLCKPVSPLCSLCGLRRWCPHRGVVHSR
jgi:endonuclease-3